MSDRLYVRLAADGGLSWLRQRTGARATSVAGVPPADALAAADGIVAIVPAEDVLLTQATLSARSRAQLMQALPYAVEEQLLAPVDDLQFAATSADEGPLGVAIVAKATLRGWLDRLATDGIRPDVLVPESLGLPTQPERAELVLDGARAIARMAPWTAFACGLAELPGWLALAGPRHPLEVRDFRVAGRLALPEHAANYHERQRDPLAFLAAHLASPPLNLLHGDFAPARRRGDVRRTWRIAALLAGACVLLAFGGLVADVVRLSHEASRLDALAGDAVRKAFPDVDPAQLERLGPEAIVRNRSTGRGPAAASGGLLRVLGEVAPILGATTRVQSRGLEYRNGTLELALHAPDLASLDLLREQVAAKPGLKAELTAANPGSDGVDGRVRIEGSATRGGRP